MIRLIIYLLCYVITEHYEMMQHCHKTHPTFSHIIPYHTHTHTHLQIINNKKDECFQVGKAQNRET